MGIKTFSFTAEYPEEDPDITGTSVFFDAVIELAVQLVQPWLKKNQSLAPQPQVQDHAGWPASWWS